jgi:hypothetical protein
VSTRARSTLAVAVSAIVLVGSGAAPVSAIARARKVADAPVSKKPAAAAGGKRAPSAPPLATGPGVSTGVMSPTEEASASAPSSGGDPLASNGLNSPLCRDSATADLSASAVRNCRLSGFEAAQAPTGDYAFDVHINSGVAHLGNEVSVMFENISQLWWTALVAVVRGVIVILDWCFTIDLLNSPAMSGIARGLRATQATFTQPWLVIVLAIASVLALYHGLIRRRVAETLGEALLMLAMMVGGLWVIMNPIGTVGALSTWANEASLGTLGAAMAGSPDHPDRTLAQSDQELFSAAINDPWCYLEFGDVSWCNDRPSPKLRAAALSIAGDPHHAPGESATLLRGARTNGEVFLALPANGPARNSINSEWSLFRVLCGSDEEPCQGPTASQAEFRTQSGTWSRVIGLVLISFGLLGMLLLLGFIALRLLHAALASLIYLLLTPAAVLAPALGESGRTAFRMWVMRLLGAITSKLLFSFLLGAVLMVERVLSSIHVFGWLTQWLLISSLWWIVFINRHKVFEFAHGERGDGRQHRSIVGRAGDVLESRKGMAAARHVKRKLTRPAPSVDPRSNRAQAHSERAKAGLEEQAKRSLEHDYRDASTTAKAAPEIQGRLADKRAQLKRLKQAHSEALARGETRRAIKLEGRAQRVEGEIASEQQTLNTAQRVAKDGEQIRGMTGNLHTREQAQERERFLDAQAALPSTVQRRVHHMPGEERDYAGMASLAGYSRKEFEGLDAPAERAARLKIDGELAKRKELSNLVAAGADEGPPERREKRVVSKEPDRGSSERPHSGGRRRPGASGGESRPDKSKREGTPPASSRTRRRNSPADDAREVARRKRQMGGDRQ